LSLEYILLFAQQAVSLAPCILLCYLPFQDALRRERRKIIAESAAACIAASTVNFALIITGIDPSGNIGVAMLLLPGFFYYRKTVREGLSKLLFVFFAVVHAGSIGGGIELAIYTFVGVSAEPNIFLTLLFISCWLIVYAIIGMVMRRFFTPRLRQINSQDMKGLWLVPLLFASVTVYLYTYFFSAGMTYYFPPVIFLFIGIMSFFVYVILLRILDSMEKKARFEREAEEAKRKVDELAAKTEFYHRMAHELLTPLTRVSTCVQTARKMPLEADELLTVSQAEIMEMAKIIKNALEERDGGG
jgi:signal transduction histidine kinase